MQITEFKASVRTFSDPGSDLIIDGNEFAVSVNGDVIAAKLRMRAGDVYVDEGTGEQPASLWILNRLARIDLLARRLYETVPVTEYFVSPSTSFLPTLEHNSEGRLVESADGLEACLSALNERSPLETMVLYLTSDAGEGKTSLINQLARQQAKKYIDKKVNWLLVPIPLGGRHFLRFDDITVGVMQNRYRFPFLYYQSFLELVKMGVIVPAFDGFEEMFVENSSGEALSAMGTLVGSLESQGAMVVAARKAYFEFENLHSKELLFDTIRTYSVGFAKLELQRWGRVQFIDYCVKRSVNQPEILYERVSERLGPTHALLTRAVLVKRLVDVAKASTSLDGFLEQLRSSGADYFSVFVRGIIEREATEKWIDRSGEKEIGTPLLTVEEHCELLSQIALSMWEVRVDYLKRDSLEFAADFFCETTKKNSFQAQQVRMRIGGHAMLVPSVYASQAVEFDHDEFRLFFLGEGIARQLRPLSTLAKAAVLGIFRRGVIPDVGMQALMRALARDSKIDSVGVIRFLLDVVSMDAQASYTHENAANLIINLLPEVPESELIIDGLSFGLEALLDKALTAITFRNCYFSNTSLDRAQFSRCSFINCTFDQLRLTERTKLVEVAFTDCTVHAVVTKTQGRELRSPMDIRRALVNAGIDVGHDLELFTDLTVDHDPDLEIVCLEKLSRYFMRSTHMSESVIRMKLGNATQLFIDETIPVLEKSGILVSIKNFGGDNQRRFRLGVTIQSLQEALSASNGNFKIFLERFA